MTILNNEWEYETVYTKYPFFDTATLQDTSGQCVIKHTWITECKLWPVLSTDRINEMTCFISRVVKSDHTLTIVFSLGAHEIGSLDIPLDRLSRQRYAVKDAARRTVGFITCTPLAMASWYDAIAQGSYVFEPQATQLLPHVCTPIIDTNVFTMTDQNDQSPGSHVLFVGGEGVHVSYDAAHHAIRIDAIGDALYGQSDCRPALEHLLQVIRPIKQLRVVDTTTHDAAVVHPNNGAIRIAVESEHDDHRSYVVYTNPGVLLSRIA